MMYDLLLVCDWYLCRLDRLHTTKMARLGSLYCGAFREQNSCQCEAWPLYAERRAVLAWVRRPPQNCGFCLYCG